MRTSLSWTQRFNITFPLNHYHQKSTARSLQWPWWKENRNVWMDFPQGKWCQVPPEGFDCTHCSTYVTTFTHDFFDTQGLSPKLVQLFPPAQHEDATTVSKLWNVSCVHLQVVLLICMLDTLQTLTACTLHYCTDDSNFWCHRTHLGGRTRIKYTNKIETYKIY